MESDTAHPIVPAASTAHASRVRFGVSLPWPIQNVGIFVVYMTAEQAGAFNANFQGLKGLLLSIPGGEAVAGRLVCEIS